MLNAPRRVRPRHQKKLPQEPEDHALGRSRGGWGTKIHLLTEGNGLPIALSVSGAQAHDITRFDELVSSVSLQGLRGRPRTRPVKLVADKAYSAKWLRQDLRRRGIGVVIPNKSNEKARYLDQEAYKKRAKVEQRNGWLKEWRAVATRYDKYAFVYKSVVLLHSIIHLLDFRFSNTA